jgi:hypothetical protein
MRPVGLARCAGSRWLGPLLAWACAHTAAGGRAEAQAMLFFKDGEPADAAAWRARLAPHVGEQLVDDPSSWAARAVAGVEAERLRPLAHIEELLARARSEAATLAEDRALGTLAEAAREAEQLGDVQGAAQWNAEIQLSIGVTAAQAGMSALATEAFRRAATLDPQRALLSAEAPPRVVELYANVARQVAVSAPGEFEVQVSAPEARVYLDDVARGLAPVRVRAPIGRHLLRVEAPGHRPYGTFIDVLEGVRPPLRVRPAHGPALEAVAVLERAARAGEYSAVVAALVALERAGVTVPVLVLESSERTGRALLVRCEPAGCRAPVRISRGALPAAIAAAPLNVTQLANGRRWLVHEQAWTAPQVPAPWWQRWYVWGGLAAAAGIAAAVVAWSVSQPPERRLRIVLEPQELRR